MKYTTPPGVFDIIPKNSKESWKNSHLWNYVENTIRRIAALYGFQEIRTPLFEETKLFQRSVGESTDIVSKEMYTFEDRGGRMLSLRPEGTAPAMRAFIEHQMHQHAPIQKLFYIAPMFRYERSQAGRYRQHHQFGVEVVGSHSPIQDVETIDLLYNVYKELGLKNLTLYLNSIGGPESRSAFRQALKDYLTPFRSELSEISQTRFEQNPLRILDSKDPKDREIVANAPSILDFLNTEDLAHFEEVKKLLQQIGIPFQINKFLVRGLDYYNKTVFEIVAGELGAQNSIGGGGRYDGLLETMGGLNLPAFGFGTGIERILQTMINQGVALPKAPHPLIYLIPMGEEAQHYCFTLIHEMRSAGISAEMDLGHKKVGKSFQTADQMGAIYCTVIGDQEMESKTVELKELATGIKTSVALQELISNLKKHLQ